MGDITTILVLSWRDIYSPKSGGAEVHTLNIMNSLNAEKYRFISFAPHYEGVPDEDTVNNITYIRKGNIYSVIWYAMRYYKEHKNEIDYVINQCNTHNFFTRFWVPSKKRIFYIHQLTKEIWDINAKFPLNKIGKRLENFSLKLNKKDPTITVSASTKEELVELGFREENIHLLYNAVEPGIIKEKIEDRKENNMDLIYVGRYAKYKGIDAAVEALGLVHEKYPQMKLRLVGKDNKKYIEKTIKPIAEKYGLTIGKRENCHIVIEGYVSEEEKLKLMERSKVLLFPSIREGWGIIVSEAAARGTPSIVYNSPGSRDAVDRGNAGYMCEENTPEDLARIIIRAVEDKQEYGEKQDKALAFVKKFNWKNNAREFEKMMADISEKKGLLASMISGGE